jgi:hypothetical protein
VGDEICGFCLHTLCPGNGECDNCPTCKAKAKQN